jgi:hypothetical protein
MSAFQSIPSLKRLNYEIVLVNALIYFNATPRAAPKAKATTSHSSPAFPRWLGGRDLTAEDFSSFFRAQLVRLGFDEGEHGIREVCHGPLRFRTSLHGLY